MQQTDPVIDRILLKEKQKLNTLLRVFYKLEIHTTQQYQVYSKRSDFDSSLNTIVFSSSVKKQLIYILGAAWLILFTCWLISEREIFLLIPLIMSALIFCIIISQYKDKDLNYRITINDNEIQINSNLFPWDNIYETAIVSQSRNYYAIRHLLIIFKDESYKAYELSALTGRNTPSFQADFQNISSTSIRFTGNKLYDHHYHFY